jgi:hypothetical protein
MAISETGQKDVADARAAQREMLSGTDKLASHFVYWFAWFWSIVSAIYFFAVSFLFVPDSNQHFADIILGFLLGTAVATIIGYFFGNADKS